MKREMRHTIRQKDEGTRLATFLAARFTYHTEQDWTRLVENGQVTLNGETASPAAQLTAHDILEYTVNDIREPPVDEDLRIVFEDNHLAVVDKPGNLPSHPGGRYFNHTLWSLLQSRHAIPSPVLINRLDRETSGLVVVAKTRAAAQQLAGQFAARHVVKRYAVLVEGSFPAHVEAAGRLEPDTSSVIRKKRRFVPEQADSANVRTADWAETAFDLVQTCGNGISVIRAHPRTGRLHQLRATLLALGHPVVGDKLYGVDETLFLRFCSDTLTPGDTARLRIRRQALHADYLRFTHPASGAPLEFTLPLPEDMQALLMG